MFLRRFWKSVAPACTRAEDQQEDAACSELAGAASDPSPSSSVLMKPTSFLREYQQGPLIGNGGFGMVYAGVRRRDVLPVAIKYIRKQDIFTWGSLDGEHLPLEYILMRRVSHVEGVIRVIDGVKIADAFVIVMERMEPSRDLCNLLTQVGALPESVAKCYFRQLVCTVLGCFEAGVYHRDLKAENILVNTRARVIKLIDFGCGTMTQDKPFRHPVGTPYYYPPEYYCEGCYFGNKATVWSLGIILYMMVCGKLPFQTQILNPVVNSTVKFDLSLSSECQDLIQQLLEINPSQRLSLEGIAHHSWLSSAPTR